MGKEKPLENDSIIMIVNVISALIGSDFSDLIPNLFLLGQYRLRNIKNVKSYNIIAWHVSVISHCRPFLLLSPSFPSPSLSFSLAFTLSLHITHIVFSCHNWFLSITHSFFLSLSPSLYFCVSPLSLSWFCSRSLSIFLFLLTLFSLALSLSFFIFLSLFMLQFIFFFSPSLIPSVFSVSHSLSVIVYLFLYLSLIFLLLLSQSVLVTVHISLGLNVLQFLLVTVPLSLSLSHLVSSFSPSLCFSLSLSCLTFTQIVISFELLGVRVTLLKVLKHHGPKYTQKDAKL